MSVSPSVEHACHGRLDLFDQLAEAGDQAGEAELDRPHVENFGDQRVARLCATDGHRAGGAVHALEVDRCDEVVLRGDLAGEAVVGLERDRLAGIDLERGLEVGPEGPDDLVTADPVADRGRHQARSGATVSSST